MKTVKGMEKNSKVGTGSASYDGTKDQDVKEVFNEALAQNGLCILPIEIQDETQISRWEEETNYGTRQKQSVFTRVKTKYLLLHESGESQVLSGYGHGVDTQDKGAGKATTYALKNCLLLTFLTPVGKMPDTDLTHSDDIPTPTTKKKTEDQKAIENRKLVLVEEIKQRILENTGNDVISAQKALVKHSNGKAKSTEQLKTWDFKHVKELHDKICIPQM